MARHPRNLQLPQPADRIARFDPAGRKMREIALPTAIPTCCEFGGPDLDVLYVTTAKLRKLEGGLAGGLFALDVGVKGLTLPAFRG